MLQAALQAELDDGEHPLLYVSTPTFFGVSYVINPWMVNQVGHVNNDLAFKQWTELTTTLSELTEVHIISCNVGILPDATFIANAGSFLPRHDGEYVFFSSKFKFPERRHEERFFINTFIDEGFKVDNLDGDYLFEGDGDLLRLRDLLVIGHGFRTSFSFIDKLSTYYGKEGVLALNLVDPRFYHLDTCFFYHYACGREACTYFPQAFDSNSLSLLRKALRERGIPALEVSEVDAVNMACNAVGIGDMIIAHKFSQKLKRWFEKHDFRTIAINLSEFHKAGGSAKCLTIRVPSQAVMHK